MLRLLASSGREFTVKELAEQLSSTKSTIQRDLATLEQDFALIEERVGKQKKTYRIDEAIKALESLTFGTAELLSLHAASGALAGLASTPLYDDLLSVIRKLRGFLSPRHNGGLDKIAGVFISHSRGFVSYDEHGEVIDDLATGIAQLRYCDIRYHSAWKNETKDYRIRPLKLLWHNSALYLLALVEGRPGVSTFAVQRFESVTVDEESFPSPRVNVEDHVRRAFGIWVSDDGEEEIEILFDAETAWRIEERVFHPDEKKERLEDGQLRYTLKTNAQWEVIPWVLSFGAHAELVSPVKWRACLHDAVVGLQQIYSETVE